MGLCIHKSFRWSIHDHLGDWNIVKIDLLSSYLVTDVMVLDVKVLCLSMVDRIVCKCNRSLVVVFE